VQGAVRGQWQAVLSVRGTDLAEHFIEGRQRGRAYVGNVVSAFRRAVDAIRRGEAPPEIDLDNITEGNKQTAGAYERSWR